MLGEQMAEEDAPSENLFRHDPKAQSPERGGYTRDENVLREWHREVFGESLWIDSDLHEAIRGRAIEFRRNPDEEIVPWQEVRNRLADLSALRAAEHDND